MDHNLDSTSYGKYLVSSNSLGTAGNFGSHCPYCSHPPFQYIYHFGLCPKIESIEYYDDGHIKRISFK